MQVMADSRWQQAARACSAAAQRALWSGPSRRRSMAQQTEGATHFGSQEVPLADKQLLVDGVFRSVARRYDLMNDLMSGGLHRAWKAAMITALNPPRSAKAFSLLDVAGGTGDIAFRAAASAGDGFRAVVCDINPDMLAVGRQRAAGQ